MHPFLKAGDSMISFTLGVKTKKGHCCHLTLHHGSLHLIPPHPIPLGLPEPSEKMYLCENKYSNCSRFKKKKKAASWLWVGDAYHSTKPCGLQAV